MFKYVRFLECSSWKSAFAGYSASIASADMDFNQLEAFLTAQTKKQGGITCEQAAVISKFWKNQKTRIRESLLNQSRWDNGLRGLSWRVDGKSQSRHEAQIHTPVAIIELEFGKSGQMSPREDAVLLHSERWKGKGSLWTSIGSWAPGAASGRVIGSELTVMADKKNRVGTRARKQVVGSASLGPEPTALLRSSRHKVLLEIITVTIVVNFHMQKDQDSAVDIETCRLTSKLSSNPSTRSWETADSSKLSESKAGSSIKHQPVRVHAPSPSTTLSQCTQSKHHSESVHPVQVPLCPNLCTHSPTAAATQNPIPTLLSLKGWEGDSG
ncbi:hypothetical protein A6R68_18811 [Neotoma lepida]|uniref:COMMD1 N-terminal domain-containing protein n=1 Tax=Neotoma lepida TaxID=56216 RepID=A0A1A6HM70_NEOLE|nr:hypothetical protein A6R68_18811 [Neotoma lepida]